MEQWEFFEYLHKSNIKHHGSEFPKWWILQQFNTGLQEFRDKFEWRERSSFYVTWKSTWPTKTAFAIPEGFWARWVGLYFIFILIGIVCPIVKFILKYRWKRGNGSVTSSSQCSAVAAAAGATRAAAVNGGAVRAASAGQAGAQQEHQCHQQQIPCC